MRKTYRGGMWVIRDIMATLETRMHGETPWRDTGHARNDYCMRNYPWTVRVGPSFEPLSRSTVRKCAHVSALSVIS